MPKDYYIQPDASDPLLSETQVLDIVRQYVPNARAVTKVDETGGEARSCHIDENLLLNTQRPPRLRPRTSLKKEVFFIN